MTHTLKSRQRNDTELAKNERIWLEPAGAPDRCPPKAVTISDAARDVLTERRRQIEAEGWTPEHDDQHANGEMAAAAACYAFSAARSPHNILNTVWPWSLSWWKPKDKRRDLVKAAALILAEIERLDRAAALSSEAHNG